MHAAEPEPGGGRDTIAAARLDEATASSAATTLQAPTTPSGLLILTTLRHAACAVTELATAIGMEQSAVSHQPRLLRVLDLVTGQRDGRRTDRWIELDENGEWPSSHLGGQGPAHVSRAEPSRSPGGRRG